MRKTLWLMMALFVLFVVIILSAGILSNKNYSFSVNSRANFTPTMQPQRTVEDKPASRTFTPFEPLPIPTATQFFTITSTLTASETVRIKTTAASTPFVQETGVANTASWTLTAPTAVSLPAETLPEHAFIQGYEGHAQLFSLDCEARAAVDLAAFFDVEIDEMHFLDALPRSDDPHEGFVGDIDGIPGQIPPDSYGVYANPIARLLRNYGLNAYGRQDMTFDELKQQIAAGKPVMVWVIGQVEAGVPLAYIPSSGNRITVAEKEHTVVIIGYDKEFVYVIDPAGNQFYMRTIDRFLESWQVLNFMAVIVEDGK